MFCGFKPEDFSTPENIEEDIRGKWNKPVVTYSILNLTPKLTKESIHQQIDLAFKVWGKHIALKFKKVTPNEESDIKISFCEKEHGDGFPFSGRGGVLAHGFYPGSGIGGDLHFDKEEPWSDKETPPGVNLFAVSLHEIGHSLGLKHSKNANSIMFPSYRNEWSKKTDNFLSKEDIERIQKVYGERKKSKVKIFDDDAFTIRVKKSEENNKIKLIIEKK